MKAVDGVSFSLDAGRRSPSSASSGCGKSVTALSVMRLVADPPGRIVGGSVRLEALDLSRPRRGGHAAIRGKEISMIFQEPMTSLNPVMTIGRQIAEALMLHEQLSRAALARPRRCCNWWAFPGPASASRSIPTSSPAACVSGP